MSRFDGVSGKEKVLELLANSPLLCGLPNARELANGLYEHMTITNHQKAEYLIRQDDDGDEVFFILMGSVRIEVLGSLVARRVSGDTVGEIAAIRPAAKRSADVITDEATEVASITATRFNQVLEGNSGAWKNLAAILGGRLGQRNFLHREPNKVPIIFIGSSGDSLSIAKAIEAGLNARMPGRCIIHRWDIDVFALSEGTMERLEKESAEVDFAILVAAEDDIERRGGRWKQKWVSRDNVIFEAGLFMGSLSRLRTFLVCPVPKRKAFWRAEFKLPSDLDGITTARYKSAIDLIDSVEKIAEAVTKHGVLKRFRSDFGS